VETKAITPTVQQNYRLLVPHPGWLRTRGHLLDALASGARTIVLMGEPGSGKSLMLQDCARILTAGGTAAQSRSPLNERDPSTHVDLVDDVDEVSLARLLADHQFHGPRVLVVAPASVAALSSLAPEARFVSMEPLGIADVHAILGVRLADRGFPADSFTNRAISRLLSASAGNARKLDGLAAAALRTAHNAGSARVLGLHVDEVVGHVVGQLARSGSMLHLVQPGDRTTSPNLRLVPDPTSDTLATHTGSGAAAPALPPEQSPVPPATSDQPARPKSLLALLAEETARARPLEIQRRDRRRRRRRIAFRVFCLLVIGAGVWAAASAKPETRTQIAGAAVDIANAATERGDAAVKQAEAWIDKLKELWANRQ
jgi:hypothetical protein